MKILRESEVSRLLSVPELLRVAEKGYRLEYNGEIERPEKPYLPVGVNHPDIISGDRMGTGITMPAYVHGSPYYAVKIVGVHRNNKQRGYPTVVGQVVLHSAKTSLPVSYMAGTELTDARTGCIGGLAVRELSSPPVTVGLFGAGKQAKWQAKMIASEVDVTEIRVYSPSDSKYESVEQLRSSLNVDVFATESPTETVEGVDAVVAATTSQEPVVRSEDIPDRAVVITVGSGSPTMQEVDAATLHRASTVFADVPEKVAKIGDLKYSELGVADLIEFGAVFERDGWRDNPEDIVVVESTGSASIDAVVAEHIFEKAVDRDVGLDIDLYP